MADLSTLTLDVTKRLGTENTGYFTEARKIETLNQAAEEILLRYDIQEFITEANVVFTTGVGSKPADYLRKIGRMGQPVRDLWNTTTEQDYQRVDIDRFGDEIDNTWTDKEGSFQIYPADTVTLRLRYVKKFTAMVDSDDESGFPPYLDGAHAYWAAYLLLFHKRDFDTAQFLLQKAQQEIQEGISALAGEKGDVRSGSMQTAILKASPSRGSTNDNLFIL